ncbi:hypothetical protein PV08_02240 [Exophiala spinifera]|uniref:DUF7924 domain-containing protein n=1 Tax=Exophiala spinifera TaxID=91928 RepID=A0A0D2BTC2_9EURO|nr:uncharacterized protein PV08_02240 [Exophiala spinifera]KIW21660.1 hypothetical protein PV08_02240 [Exophiala spinifera]
MALNLKTLHRSLQLQEKQAANQQRIAGEEPKKLTKRSTVKQYRDEKSKDSAASLADLETRKSIKRQRGVSTEDVKIHDTRHLERRRTQYTEARTIVDKVDFVESWLNESCWPRRTSTGNELLLSKGLTNMPPKPTPANISRKTARILASPENGSESTMNSSTKSEKSTASVNDTNYHEPLSYRNIFIEHENPPPELMRRAQKIISGSRASLGVNDAAINKLKDKALALLHAPENDIIHQLAHDIIPAMKDLPDPRLERNYDQLWSNSVPDPLPLPIPKPDLVFGYSKAAFTNSQIEMIGRQQDDQFGQSYAIPDQRIRFPFLQVEFKSQAKRGTHYVARNQAAGAGAIALNGLLELIRRGSLLDAFDYEEPLYFSITMDQELARIYVHWLKAPAEGQSHGFRVKRLSQYDLWVANDIRALSRAIKNILDNGAGTRLQTICRALDVYHEMVVHDRNAINEHGERHPEPHTKQLQEGAVASCEFRTSQSPLEPVQPVSTGNCVVS